MSDSVSRRRFLAASGAVLGLGPLVAACGGGGGDTAAASCEGYAALSSQELQQRRALNYVDASPYPEKLCSNCQFYKLPAGSPCGGCQLFPGPVAPGGYCTSWVVQRAG